MQPVTDQKLPRRITLFYQRVGIAVLLCVFISLIFVVPAAMRVMSTNQNDVNEWLPAGFQETKDVIWFSERFVSDEILVASWPGCTLNDPRLPELAEELGRATIASVRSKQASGLTKDTKPEEQSADALLNPAEEISISDKEDAPLDTAHRPLFKQVFIGTDVAEQIFDVLGANNGRQTDETLQTLDTEVRHRMSGWLLGPDGETTCAVAIVSRTGVENRHAAVEAMIQAAKDVGVEPGQLRIGGPTSDSVAIDNASQRYMVEMFLGACVLSMIVAWLALRKLSLVFIVFGTAFYCELMSLALMDITGQPMNSVLIMVPTLIYVLSVSGSIHLINYYLDAFRHGDKDVAIGQMVINSITPCLLASLTTSIGVGSLAISELVPIRKFGMYAAGGTLVAFVLLYLLLPSVLSIWHKFFAGRSTSETESQRIAQVRRSTSHRLIHGLGRFVIRGNVPIALLGVLILGICAVGVMKVQTAVKLKALFDPQSKVVQNYQWLETNLGPLVPVEIVLRFPQSGDSSPVDRLTLTSEVQQRLAKIEGVGGTLSTATFSPQPPSGSDFRATAARTQINRTLERRRDEIVQTGYLAEKDDEELWRISARVPAMSDEDYGRYVKEIRENVEAQLKESDSESAAEAQYVISGGVPLFSSASRVLLSDLQSSFTTAFLLIAVAMFCLVTIAMARAWTTQGSIHWWSVLWRAVCGSALAMIPNIFPVLLVFGVMGGLGVKVDIGAMMTASVALGIAVDDTLHFLTWFQRGMLLTGNRCRAVLAAYRHCALAMFQTSMICSLGLLAFSPSEFIPISRFSWLMCALLFAALLGDMVLLPAILVSSLGRVFKLPSKFSPPPDTTSSVPIEPSYQSLKQTTESASG